MEKRIHIENIEEQRILFGPRDRHLRLVRDHFHVRISARRGEVRIDGAEGQVLDAYVVILQLLDHIRQRGELDADQVETHLASQTKVPVMADRHASNNNYRQDSGRNGGNGHGGHGYAGRRGQGSRRDYSNAPREELDSSYIERSIADMPMLDGSREGFEGRASRVYAQPLTDGQAVYLNAIRNHDLVFAIGPAGTGKTFLATAMAVEQLNRGEVRKLVLVRPAVEAGEKLGYLPGDLQAKVNPYLRPIFDALGSLLSYSALRRYVERDVIEIAPLAYMRGRTLENAFIILDEAQNTTPSQMMMFLTRFGRGSKVVVTGDVTQIDLPLNQVSGLVDSLRVLRNVPGIEKVELTEKDIVRHGLVAKIVAAYGAAEEEATVPLTRQEKTRPTRFDANAPAAPAANGGEKDEARGKPVASGQFE